MRIPQRILWIAFLLPTLQLSAQLRPVVESSVEKDTVLLGEVFRYRIQVQLPLEMEMALQFPDSIPHFEFAQKPVIDSSDEKGAKNIKMIYYLSSFDSGHWVIPSWQLAPGLSTDTIGVNVVFSPFDPEQPYHDIKDIIEVKEKRKQAWWWLAAGAALLLALIAFYFFRKKRQALPPQKPVLPGDPYAEAIRQLEALQQERPGAKEYHTRLVTVFRSYLFRRTGILSLQQTTDDLLLQLKDAGLPVELFNSLAQSLRLSDFVKFARFHSAAADDENCYRQIKSAIQFIEESRKAAAAAQTQ